MRSHHWIWLDLWRVCEGIGETQGREYFVRLGNSRHRQWVRRDVTQVVFRTTSIWDNDTARHHRWRAYVKRIARAWNALSLGALVMGLEANTPPLILAGALEDDGRYDGLRDLIVSEFLCDFDLRNDADMPYPLPLPPLLDPRHVERLLLI